MPERWEIRTEVDSGISLVTGDRWAGWRVRYRRAGSKGRFRSFLLEAAELPTDEQLERICDFHVTGNSTVHIEFEASPAS